MMIAIFYSCCALRFSASLQAASLKPLERREGGALRRSFSASLQAASLKLLLQRFDEAVRAGFSASLQAASLKREKSSRNESGRREVFPPLCRRPH